MKGSSAIGQDALREKTGSLLTLFDHSASLLKQENQVVWQVVYVGRQVLRWGGSEKPPIGEYTVVMQAKTGEPTKVSWSLDGVETGRFTKETWGQAKAYDASVLPYFKALMDAVEPSCANTALATGMTWPYRTRQPMTNSTVTAAFPRSATRTICPARMI